MYLIAIAWLYAALMWSLAEGFDPKGTVLGASFTFILYGLLPVGIVTYILGSPSRRRSRQAEVLQEEPPTQPSVVPAGSDASAQADAGRHPAGDLVAAERKEP